MKSLGLQATSGTYRLNGPGEPPEEGEMIIMTLLPSRHRILNSSPASLSPSTLSHDHGGMS